MKEQGFPSFEIFTPQGVEEMGVNVKDMLPGLFGGKSKRKKMRIGDAREIIVQEEAEKLVDQQNVAREAIERVEQSGIVFLDEIDKIAGRQNASHGPDVSREGVQRDLLPIVEGTTVNTKYGMVKTDHILFIAAGAFHVSKPSDLIPELQGRFPIRVELESLTEDDFVRILREPKNALTKQYTALLGDRRRDADLRRRRGRARSPATPRSSTRRRRTSAPAACTRSSSACSTSSPSTPARWAARRSRSTPRTCSACWRRW